MRLTWDYSLSVALLILAAVACNPVPARVKPPTGIPLANPAWGITPTAETTSAENSVPDPSPSPVASRIASPSPTVEPTLAPDPLAVKIHPDATRRVSALITESGGTVLANGSDGTRFRLELPPGSLEQPTEITVSPITTIERVPFSGGLVAGVTLEPDGLRFSSPVTLTVETPAPIGSAEYETIAFAAHGDGREFHLYPSRTQSQLTTMMLMHFSSRGIGKATQADVARQKREHAPTDPVDRLQQDLAGQQERAVLVKQMTNAYLYIESMVNNARTGAELEAANHAYAEWLSALNTLDLWDDLKENFDLLDSLFAVRVHDLIARLAQECADQKNLTHINELLKWYRRARASWGIDYWMAEDAERKMESSVNRCLSFDLNFESTIRTEFSLITSVYSARAQIKLHVDPDGKSATGSAPVELSLKETGNTPYLHILDSGAKGGDLQVSLDLFGSGAQPAQNFEWGNVVLILRPGMDSRFSVQQACGPIGCGDVTTNREPIWTNVFQSLHADEGGAGGIEIRGWTMKSAGATKLYSRSKGVGPLDVQEVTSLWLIHNPPH